VKLGCVDVCSAEGLPVDGVKVDVSGPTPTTVTTGENGQYVAVVKEGSYVVTPSVAAWRFGPQKTTVGVHNSVSGVNFNGCPHASAGAAADAAGVWDLEGGSCLNQVHVTYDPSSKAMTVGWYSGSVLCSNNGKWIVAPTISGFTVDDGTAVPASDVSSSGAAVTARINTIHGVPSMAVALNPGVRAGPQSCTGRPSSRT
jgi:hypothetical protein